MKNSILQNKAIKFICAIIFWIGVWYLAALITGKEIFLPYPHTVVERFFALLVQPDFFTIVLASLARILFGFVLGATLGFFLAILTNYSKIAEMVVAPFIRVVRATPVVSFILLAYLWLNNDTIPVFIALLMVAPIIWQNVSSGLMNLDINLLEMAKVFKISRTKKFFKIILPQLSHIYILVASLHWDLLGSPVLPQKL